MAQGTRRKAQGKTSLSTSVFLAPIAILSQMHHFLPYISPTIPNALRLVPNAFTPMLHPECSIPIHIIPEWCI